MRALITGCTGQDGSYLSEFLLHKGYTVVGIARRSSTTNRERLWWALQNKNFSVIEADVNDPIAMRRILVRYGPFDEVYNLAAQSFVHLSWSCPLETMQTNGVSPVALLDSVLDTGNGKTKVYQASTSEMWGSAPPPQNETTPFLPNSPYAVAKTAAHYAVRVYRESFGLFACSGILCNHEGPRRGREFVTRKIAVQTAEIYAGMRGDYSLGDLTPKRDWGLASEYVIAMWKMLQQSTPDDYVIATGETHTIQEFVDWCWESIQGIGPAPITRQESMTRPKDVPVLCGDPSKAHMKLGWYAKTKAHDLAGMMVYNEVSNGGRLDKPDWELLEAACCGKP